MKKVCRLVLLTILLVLPISGERSYSFAEEETKLATERAVDPEARDLCLKGEEYLEKFTAEDLEKAIDYFEKAIEKDAAFVAPYVGLANAYITIQYVTPVSPKKVMPKATGFALKALEIDGTNGDAHGMLGWIYSVYEWDWARGEKEYKRAIELNPNDLYAHEGYAQVLAYAGRFEEAIEMAKRALELDPQAGIANLRLGEVLLHAGRYEETIQHLQKSIEMFPDYPYMRSDIGIAYLALAKHEDALKQFQAQKDLSLGTIVDFETDHWIGTTHALMGEKDKAKKILADLEEKSREAHIPPTLIARLYSVLGDQDKAYEWLDRAYEQHDPWLCELKNGPGGDIFNLRSDPRFQAMLKKINL